ncbi:hypothetical protein BDR26DRAFT_1005169 [Obelidium mucronatum]|nr:hypothetical protein BDR26DRAFT_1005169 [Obelidium mucronatum]
MAFTSSIGSFLIVWCILWLITVGIYYHRRNKNMIKARSMLITMTQAVSALIALLSLTSSYLESNTPCFLKLWAINLSVMVYTSNTFLKNIYLYIQYRYNQNMLFQESKQMRPGASLSVIPQQVDEFGYPLTDDQIASRSVTTPDKKDEFSAGSKEPPPETKESKKFNLKETFNKVTDKWIVDKVIYKRIQYSMGSLYVVMTIYVLAVQLTSDKNTIIPPNATCTFDLIQYGLLIFGVLFIQIFGGIFATWLVCDIRDNNFVAFDVVISCTVGAICAIIYLLFQEVPSLNKLPFSSNWIVTIPLFLTHITGIILPIILSYIEDYRTSRVTIELNLQSFQQALEDRTLFEDIKQYAIKDMCGENIFFLEALRELKRDAMSEIIKSRSSKPIPSSSSSNHNHNHTASESNARKSLAFGNMKFITQKNNPALQELFEGGSSSGFRKGSRTNSGSVTNREPRQSSSTVIHERKQTQTASYTAATATTTMDDGCIEGNRSVRKPSFVIHSQTNSFQLHVTPAEMSSIQEESQKSSRNKERGESILSLNIIRSESCSISGSEKLGQTIPMAQQKVPTDIITKYNQFYNLYCKSGGQMEVNLSGEVRTELRALAKSGEWKVGSFDRAKGEILNVLFTNIYCRWAYQKIEKRQSKV